MDRQTIADRQKGRYTNRQIDKQKDIKIDRNKNKQIDKWTD